VCLRFATSKDDIDYLEASKTVCFMHRKLKALRTPTVEGMRIMMFICILEDENI
jgi:hypothetical protein